MAARRPTPVAEEHAPSRARDLGPPDPEVAVRGNASSVVVDAEGAGESEDSEAVLEAAAREGLILFEWTPARGLVFLSGPSEDFLGYRREELMADASIAARVVDPSFLEKMGPFSAQIHEAQVQPHRIQIPLVGRDGTSRLFDVRLSPISDSGGRIEGFVGAAFDPSSKGHAHDLADGAVRALAAKLSAR